MKPHHSLLLFLALADVASAQLKTGSNTETITSTANFEVESTTGSKTVIDKTSGNVGIGMTTPASTLSVNGSLATNYTSVTATTYTLTAMDSTVVWDGSAAGTVTLPAAIAGAGNFKGRTYTVKNTSGAHNVTISAAGSELIGTNSSLTLAPQASTVFVSTGATSGATWQSISQTGTFSISGGTVVDGPDLAGLPVTTVYISDTRWNSADSSSSDVTDATADFPSAEIAAAMNSMPDGGVIKIILPANSTGVNPSNFDIAPPDASAYVGKAYYFYVDWELSGQQMSSNTWPIYLTYIIPTASDRIPIGPGITPAAGNYVSLNATLGTQASYTYPTHKDFITPIFRIHATGPNHWLIQNAGNVINYNLISG